MLKSVKTKTSVFRFPPSAIFASKLDGPIHTYLNIFSQSNALS
jgi:hypothetical protein